MNIFRVFSREYGPRAAGASADRAAAAIQSVACTHVGLVRAVNEDRVLDLPDANLWAVADGMGGHHSGDVAAQIAVDALTNVASSGRALGGDDILVALQSANRLIYDRYANTDRRSGTTIVAALSTGAMIEIFWAGDSRAYRLRAGKWDLLTRDHSVVQQMVDAGALSPLAAAAHPKSNVITRALGVDSEVVVDRIATEFLAGDMILLCSDGVSRTLNQDTPSGLSTALLAQFLLDQALVRDGSDNASLVLIAAT